MTSLICEIHCWLQKCKTQKIISKCLLSGPSAIIFLKAWGFHIVLLHCQVEPQCSRLLKLSIMLFEIKIIEFRPHSVGKLGIAFTEYDKFKALKPWKTGATWAALMEPQIGIWPMYKLTFKLLSGWLYGYQTRKNIGMIDCGIDKHFSMI